ncbi:SUMO protein smt3 [Elasticomyces elasticus]|nr:SUMO protein smt3 [Elasticomyces elasticus]
MATEHIPVIVNDDGYFRKQFGIKPNMSVKKLVDRYCRGLCLECTEPDIIEFWFETTKVGTKCLNTGGVKLTHRQLDDQTAEALGLQKGDTIDVRMPEQCTRSSCPLPPGQTVPNIHYLYQAAMAKPKSTGEGDVEAEIEEPDGTPPATPDRIVFSIAKPGGESFKFHTKKTTPMARAMKVFAERNGLEVWQYRFLHEELRLIGHETPAMLRLEDNDQIDCHTEQRGGTAGLSSLV